MNIIKSDFICNDVRCDGDLLLPERIENPPVIIMAHGLAAQKNFGLMAYAKRFVEANIAVFLFDYRTFGKSGGRHRQIVDPFHHLEDWKKAVSHVRTLKEIDSGKIALWGSSFSGGHVLVIASEDDNISAVVSQVPYISAVASIKTKKFSDAFLSTLYGGYDLIRSAIGMSPHYSPVIARPGSFAAMNSEESFDGYMAIVGEDTTWENKMSSRGFIKMAFYNPIRKAKKVKAPVLMIAGSDDSLIPLSATKKCAQKLPDGELFVLQCNHFAPYTGDIFLKHIDRQVAFFEKHLIQDEAF